jgi:hypothetical protein
MRPRYYIVFASICIGSGLLGTATGYIGIGAMTPSAALGLIFLNPLFFAVMIAATTLRPAIIAILIGVPLGPIFHMVSPDWGLLATGLAGGTLAFWIHRKTSAKNT